MKYSGLYFLNKCDIYTIKMFGCWKGQFSITFLCLKVITAFIYFTEDSECAICSNHHLAQTFLSDVTSHCYGIRMPQFSYWRLCEDDMEEFTCRNVEKYITVLPSCAACSQLGLPGREACYRQQIEGARCAIDQLLVPVIENSFTCKKDRGQCVLQRKPLSPTSSSYTTTKTTTTTAATTITQSTYRGRLTTKYTTQPDHPDATENTISEDTASAGAHFRPPRERKCPRCEVCSVCEQTGAASAGLAIGLFFLGLIVGTMVSSAVCLFCPAIHRKSSEVVQNRLLGKRPCPDNTHSTAGNQANEVTPSAPPLSLPRNYPNSSDAGDTYHDLHDRSNRDSHTYSGLQSPIPDSGIYNDPGASDTYDAPHDRVSQSSLVNSPTYQLPVDGVVSGTANQNNRTNVRNGTLSNSVQDDNYDHTNRGTRDVDTNRTGNRYDTLQPNNQNASNSRNTRGLSIPSNDYSDHQYFVLEPGNNNNSDSQTNYPEIHHQSPNRDSTYTVNHNYFVLEKQ